MFVFTIGDIIGLSLWGLFLAGCLLVWGIGKIQQLVRKLRK